MGLRSLYGLPIFDEEVGCTVKIEWCKKVKGAIYRFALNELNTVCKACSKTYMLPFHSNLKCQEHINYQSTSQAFQITLQNKTRNVQYQMQFQKQI